MTKKILYVEDDKTYRALFALGPESMLKGHGIEVNYADSKESALALIANEDYAVVLSDGNLEGDEYNKDSSFTGTNVIKAAKEKGMYTIGLSSKPSQFERLAGENMDVNYQKPYDCSKLIQFILDGSK